MRSKLMQSLAAGAAALFFQTLPQLAQAQSANAAIEGVVASEAEGAMEGVVVSARKPGGTVMVSVTSDDKGRFSFPKDRLEPGEYNIMIRAVGYDLPAKVNANVAADKPASLDIKLRKARNLSAQLTNTEWLMSMPGTPEQKDFLSDCMGCHTLERIMRSTHGVDEWMDTIHRMRGYAPVSQPIKPQRMLDASRAGNREDYRKAAEYLATVNLSENDTWQYPLKTLPRPKGRDTKVITTEYFLPRPTIEPHDVILDKDGVVWYSNFGEMFVSSFDTRTLKHTEYPVKQYKANAPVGILDIEFDKNGMLWFDSMYQGALTMLDPKTGESKSYPVPAKWNDDRAQLNFVGVRHDVDGKVWTKDVGTQNVLRLDIKTGEWELHRPTDKLQGQRGIYQLVSDSKNNAWLAEFANGHLGRIDAKTGEVKWFATPTPRARARRMEIDDNDVILVTLYRANGFAFFDTKSEKYTEYKLPQPWALPYRAVSDKAGDVWISTMSSDRVVRFTPSTGRSTEYLMPTETNMRSAHVDKTGPKPVFWVGSNHTAALVKVEPLD